MSAEASPKSGSGLQKGRKAWWILLAGGGVVVWRYLTSAQAPPIERVYLPILLAKFLIPELVIVAVGVALYLGRDKVGPMFAKAYRRFILLVLPPPERLPMYLVGLSVVLVLTKSIWWSPAALAAWHAGEFVQRRGDYYQLLLVDYYGVALRNEANIAYERGSLDVAQKLHAGATRWEEARADTLNRVQEEIEGRLRYAQNQADRAAEERKDGLSPTVVSLDIDTFRANPGNRAYAAQLGEDQKAIRRLENRMAALQKACSTAPFAKIEKHEIAPFDSFAPHSVDPQRNDVILCSRLRAACDAAGASCSDSFRKHMQADRIELACRTVAEVQHRRNPTTDCAGL